MMLFFKGILWICAGVIAIGFMAGVFIWEVGDWADKKSKEEK